MPAAPSLKDIAKIAGVSSRGNPPRRDQSHLDAILWEAALLQSGFSILQDLAFASANLALVDATYSDANISGMKETSCRGVCAAVDVLDQDKVLISAELQVGKTFPPKGSD